MEDDRKKRDKQAESEEATPSFDEVVRKMLNTPPKPKRTTPKKLPQPQKRSSAPRAPRPSGR